MKRVMCFLYGCLYIGLGLLLVIAGCFRLPPPPFLETIGMAFAASILGAVGIGFCRIAFTMETKPKQYWER